MTDSFIEQAVFTSVCTENARGYQLASSSKGVSNDDKRFLATSGPSHDSLLNTSPGAYSVSCQEFESGCHCIGRTTVAGEEYSNRKGPRIYTQYLLVPTEVFARFSYSPFAFLRAATASGHICVHDNVPSELKSFRLIGRASSVDDRAVAKFVDTHGVHKFVAMVKQAIVQPSLMIISKDPTAAIESLLSCLSLELRKSVSFSTFLRFSPRRPFRLLGMLNDQAEQRRVQGYQRSVVFPV